MSSKDKKKPSVSIIMNAFNGEKYLREALDSVLKQSYANWELIFWDNQSTDKSSEIFLSYDDDRLKYFYAPSHTPLYEARNYAVEKSEGEFLAFLDVDDWWLPTKLEQQLSLFVDQEVGLVYSNFYWKNEIKGIEYIAHKQQLPSGFVLEDILQNYVVGLLTIIVRRVAYEQVKPGFNPIYNIIGDFDFAIRLSENWKFAAIQSPTAYCRWHGGNLQISEEWQHLDELEQWVELMNENHIISQKLEFQQFINKVNRMRSVFEAKKGNYLYALKNLFLVSGLINKIKILVAIILPSKILNFLVRKIS
jgi:glycosyltransferase involved in cell wall biosynthesis